MVGHHPVHRLGHPIAALRVGVIVAHHQRHLLGGQRAAHLEVGGDLEVVSAPEQVQRGQPVLGVRAAGERDGPGGVLVAVAALDHIGVLEITDTAVAGGRRVVGLGFQHRGPHAQAGHPHVFDQGSCARVVAGAQTTELLAAGPLDVDVLAPGERRRGERHAEQPDDRAQHYRGATQPGPPGHHRRSRCAALAARRSRSGSSMYRFVQ